jgi:triacylglycerol lipase
VFEALSPQRRRMLIAMLALLVLVPVLIGAVLLVRSMLQQVESVPQEQPGPVLLVPGYGGTGDSLQPLADALRRAGREALIVPPVGDGRGDLRAQADHLQEVADNLLSETGAPSVDLIGYSAGGVVARLWIAEGDGAGRVRRVLTLGSPHHGTSQAALGRELAGGCPTACEQLVPDSDLLRRLNAQDETPAGPMWITVRSTADQVVTPVDSAELSGALNVLIQDLCPQSAAEHADLPHHPVVLAGLDSFLGSTPPSPPRNVTC